MSQMKLLRRIFSSFQRLHQTGSVTLEALVDKKAYFFPFIRKQCRQLKVHYRAHER